MQVKKNNKKIKKEYLNKTYSMQGITLISLVVTIIVLIILAGVTLNLVLKQDGIINLAKQAEKNYIVAEEQDKKDLENLYSSIMVATGDEANITISMQDLKSLIDSRVEAKLQEDAENKIQVVESYSSENKSEGYIVYSNGLIQEWGEITTGTITANGGTNTTINLMKKFTTANYNIQITVVASGNWAHICSSSCNINKNTFDIRIWNLTSSDTSNIKLKWMAIGY